MAKVKVELNYEELNALNDPEAADDTRAMIFAMVEECLNRRADNTKCSVTIDSDKE